MIGDNDEITGPAAAAGSGGGGGHLISIGKTTSAF